MAPITCCTDAEGRLRLPEGFANSTLVVEQVSDTELRIRKADVVSEEEQQFEEERWPTLSPRDQEFLAKLILNPPPANDALRKAMEDYRREYE
jgi:hypothetical protein